MHLDHPQWVHGAAGRSGYPYWSGTKVNGQCVFEFGNVSSRVNTFGKDAEYGTDQFMTLGYPEFIGSTHNVSNC